MKNPGLFSVRPGLVESSPARYPVFMRKCWLFLLILSAVAGGAGWWQRDAIREWSRAEMESIQLVKPAMPVPDPEAYEVLVTELERWRLELAGRHAKARTEAERKAVEADARLILEFSLPAMMRCWLGTPWDFHGTAAKPGDSGIACGYFVSTVLRDAGFRLDRYRLAQQPSENILRSFLPKEACGLTVGQAYETFAGQLSESEHGIYLVGLDTHVAFIVVGNDGFRFIHSSGSRPWCVVEENSETAEVLRKSNWRMLGHLTASGPVIRRWLREEKIPVRGA